MLWALFFILLGDILGVEAIKDVGNKVKRFQKPLMAFLLVLLAFATLLAVGVYL